MARTAGDCEAAEMILAMERTMKHIGERLGVRPGDVSAHNKLVQALQPFAVEKATPARDPHHWHVFNAMGWCQCGANESLTAAQVSAVEKLNPIGEPK